ncbi:hypothetical protein C8R46DRAFT_1135514 [Mycena filopes]|nr:hypothetical protein C8R46DRAFT_1135514 [Mycena filopes]
MATAETTRVAERPQIVLPGPLGVNGVQNARYHHLLNSNEAPLDLECPFIQSALSSRRDRLAQHDDTGLQSEGHVGEHEALMADVARHAAILSPLRRMPAEILSEIFSSTLPSDWELLRRGKFDVNDSPWTLSHTCSRWRTIALTSSLLWSFIAIDFEVLHAPLVAYPLALLRTQLSRASQLRLSFSGSYLNFNHQITLFELLVEYSPLWVEANLTLLTELLPTIAGIRGRVPLLRSLWLEWCKPGPTQRLPEVDIDCFLTRYQCNGSWQRHLDILQSAPNLVEARVYIIEDGTSHGIPGGTVIEFRSLRLLYVSHSDILDCLRLPALRELGLIVTTELDTPSHVDTMALRSSCTLRELRVVGVAASIVTMILQNHRSITELVNVATGVQSAREANAVVSALSTCDASGAFTLAPQLAGVFFAIDRSPVDCARYLDMLSSRCKASSASGRTLRSAGLLIQPDTDHLGFAPSIRLQVGELRAEPGLDFLFVEGTTTMHMTSEWLFDPFVRRS